MYVIKNNRNQFLSYAEYAGLCWDDIFIDPNGENADCEQDIFWTCLWKSEENARVAMEDEEFKKSFDYCGPYVIVKI
jgi:hypothetical protein